MWIKICCIQNEDEARLAIRHGADAIGLVSRMPSGPGVISDERIAEIVGSVDGSVETFLLTSRLSPEDIATQVDMTKASAVQLCDRLSAADYPTLRGLLPATRLIQVVHVEGEDSRAAALELEPHVDALLLDTGRPNATVRELGGTGRTHDWSVSRRIVESATKPVYLAGGLRAENVANAIRSVRPSGVDLCSGVRVEGALDETRLRAFVAAARAGKGFRDRSS